MLEEVRDLWSASRLLLVVCVSLFIMLGAIAGWRWVFDSGGEPTEPDASVSVDDRSSSQPGSPRLYADLGKLYQGPDANVLGAASPAVDLQYRPVSARPYFAALLIAGIDSNGAPVSPTMGENALVGGAPCVDDCLEVEMGVAGGGRLVRLPVATGHTVDPESVRLNGEVLALVADVGGLPAVDLGNLGGRLTYRSAAGEGIPQAVGSGWPPLPPELVDLSAEIAGMPPDRAASAASEWVRRRVVYDASPSTAERHFAERRKGRGLFERSLLVGAGDCDIQNAVVAAVLATAGISSRLAVGWVGDSGRTQPGLHAWVEYMGADGRWRMVDASSGSGRSLPEGAPRAEPPSPGDPRAWRDRKILLGLAAAMLLAGLALWFGRSASHRHFNPGTGDGMADLVRSAVANPGSFGGVHALYHRRFVPLLGGRSISMAQAIAAGGRGKLAVGGRACGVAARAARRGTVIDRDSRVGAAAADALGAVDLDHWEHVVSRSRKDRIATRVEKVLKVAGGPYRLRVASSVGEDVSVFDGARVGLSRTDRWVVFDQDSDLWRKVGDLARTNPAAAALLLADAAFNRLGLPKAVEEACLGELARAALTEWDGGAS